MVRVGWKNIGGSFQVVVTSAHVDSIQKVCGRTEKVGSGYSCGTSEIHRGESSCALSKEESEWIRGSDHLDVV